MSLGAPLPENEARRLTPLYAEPVLDTPPEERFDRYTRIAAELFDVPIALVSLIDSDRQWFKSRLGLDVTETPRDVAFCAHTILDNAVLQVPDALQDARFADNPFVTGPARVASTPARRSPLPTAACSERSASSTGGRGSSTSSSSRCCATWPTSCRPSSCRAATGSRASAPVPTS